MKITPNTIQVPTLTYSQNKEDIILSSLLNGVTHGFYIDIGAAHPEYLSVTKLFYDNGWSGIDVEPNERLYRLLLQARSRDVIYNRAVSSSGEKAALFREYLGDGLSTLSATTRNNLEKNPKVTTKYHKDYTVETITLADIAKRCPKDVHFMKIDVEGHELAVLKSNNWNELRPWIICGETNHLSDNNWQAYIKKRHYLLVHHDGLNAYYADSKKYGTEPPRVDWTVLFNPTIVSPLWADALNEKDRQISFLTDKIRELESKIEILPTVDGEGMRFRTVAKILVKKMDAVMIGQLAPMQKSMVRQKIGAIKYVSSKDFDTLAWDAITKDVVVKKHSMARRGAFKAYMKVRGGAKRASRGKKG